MTKLPHPHQHAPLVHPARPGGGRINLQLLTAAYMRAILRRTTEAAPEQPKQQRLEGI